MNKCRIQEVEQYQENNRGKTNKTENGLENCLDIDTIAEAIPAGYCTKAIDILGTTFHEQLNHHVAYLNPGLHHGFSKPTSLLVKTKATSPSEKNNQLRMIRKAQD